MKAMLLAAGFGKRMGTLTKHLPKPLLSAGNNTLIEHNLLQLRDAGIQEVIINVHYFCDQIMNFLGNGKKYHLKIHYSIETHLLGTGGGIQNALSHFNGEPFLLLSSDIWTDYPLKQLINCRARTTHLILVNNPHFHLEGDYGLTKEGVIHFDKPKFTYANCALLHPDLFSRQKNGAYPFTDVLHPAISNKRVTGEHYNGHWFNAGTPEELNRLHTYLEMHP